MVDLTRYSASDFIPFTQDVYLRLLERVNESYWPLHIPAFALALFILVLAWRGHSVALKLLAVIWLWVAWGFLYQFYQELNWAGWWFGGAYILQAILLIVISSISLPTIRVNQIQRSAGLAIAGVAALWPTIFPLGRVRWTQLESTGIHADPTAMFTLGVLLMLCAGWRLWLLFAIPLLWGALSALTLQVLGLNQAWVLMILATFALIILLTHTFWSLLRAGSYTRHDL